jgi:homospermidine synthase
MQFNGRILVIGLGGVSRCAVPLLFKHLGAPAARYTVMDFSDDEVIAKAGAELAAAGARFVKERITRENLGALLGKYLGPGDLCVDLGWNIGCNDIVGWCRDHGVLYVNTSIEVWDPYEGIERKTPPDRTLYVRHMALRKMIAGWGDNRGPSAVLDHGANPGLVSHFTKQALEDMARQLLAGKGAKAPKGLRREKLQDALGRRAWNELAGLLGVKVIHISERDTQIAAEPKRENEFVNTWSIEGLNEEGTSPAEMGWGTHEKRLPPRAWRHKAGPRNQICLGSWGLNTWVRSWVPCGEIIGRVIRHGEAFTISDHLTVWKGAKAVYRPTVHYAYGLCDSAIASLVELQMLNYRMQPKLRILGDEITAGRDELGCLLMGHDFRSWWIGSLLDIHETRRLAPHQNATTLQVACSLVAAVLWMIRNPRMGINVPDDLPHDEILRDAMPYLGPFVSKPVDWSPLDNWANAHGNGGAKRPPKADEWQFTTFMARAQG